MVGDKPNEGEEELSNLRIISGSCDNQVYEWINNDGEWKRNKVGSHDGWVRDVGKPTFFDINYLIVSIFNI
jgi:hypothetical protein